MFPHRHRERRSLRRTCLRGVVLLTVIAFAIAIAAEFGMNIPFPTLGGRQLWADVVVRDDWRIQRHVWTGHHRLLDERDVRRAWGGLDRCVEQLEVRQPPDLRGLLPADARGRRAIVLLHGIVRSRHSLDDLHTGLEADGWLVVDIGYPSTRADLADHAAQVAGVLDALEDVTSVSFVTHSMGGLVVRTLLDRPGDAWRERMDVDRVCMLFPPNQGADNADRLYQTWWYRLMFGPAGQQLTSEASRSMPTPDMMLGIIAGGVGDDAGRSRAIPGDDDGRVSVEETKLEGAQAHIVLPVGHSFGMNDPELISAVRRWIAGGALQDEHAASTDARADTPSRR